MTKRKMFLRMVTASLLRRRSRMLIALLSIAVGATILSGLVTIYYDVPRQMGAQFRSYGANMVLLPDGEGALTQEGLNDVLSMIPDSEVVGATPYRYVRLDMPSRQQSFTGAGTDFEEVQKTSPYFSVEGAYPENAREILVGKEIAETIGLKTGSVIELSYKKTEQPGKDATSEREAGVPLSGSAEGFNKAILNVSVVLDTEGKITDLEVDASSQTPGIGANVGTDEAFLAQFNGKTPPLVFSEPAPQGEAAVSGSGSESVSAGTGETVSASEDGSESESVSAGEGGSESESVSAGEDGSESESVSAGEGGSVSGSEDGSESESGSAGEGGSESGSVSAGEGETVSAGEDGSESGSVSAGEDGSESESVSTGEDGSESESGSASEDGSESGSVSAGEGEIDSDSMIDALSGATVSSRAVVDAVNGAVSPEAAVTIENTEHFTVAGILSTGGEEESYIFMTLTDLGRLTGDELLDVAELSVLADNDELEALSESITNSKSGVIPRLVKRVTRSEASVLGKLQALVFLVTAVVLLLTMICVSTTMMAVVSERRREIGLRKALGASDSSIRSEFLGEGMFLGGLGGLLGGILGFVFAQVVSMNVFGSSISFKPLLLPVTIIVSMAVAAVSCQLPIRRAVAIDPAIVLKGE